MVTQPLKQVVVLSIQSVKDLGNGSEAVTLADGNVLFVRGFDGRIHWAKYPDRLLSGLYGQAVQIKQKGDDSIEYYFN